MFKCTVHHKTKLHLKILNLSLLESLVFEDYCGGGETSRKVCSQEKMNDCHYSLSKEIVFVVLLRSLFVVFNCSCCCGGGCNAIVQEDSHQGKCDGVFGSSNL